MSKARAKRATSLPIFPQPTSPRVRPSSSNPFSRVQLPALSSASAAAMPRAAARAWPKASSATPRALAPSARRTTTPRAWAAGRSMLSTPVPFRLMTRSRSALPRRAALTFSTPAS